MEKTMRLNKFITQHVKQNPQRDDQITATHAI